MQAIAQKVALQAALIGTMSIGSYVVRKIYKPTNHELIEKKTLLKDNIDLCYSLNGIAKLEDDEIFNLIVGKIEVILVNIKNENFKNHWFISRETGEIKKLCNLMKKRALKKNNNQILTYVIDYEKDYFPYLETQLDNLLHNSLLDTYIN